MQGGPQPRAIMPVPVRPIGAGVWQCADVAVKLLVAPAPLSPTSACVREALLGTELGHPHLVATYGGEGVWVCEVAVAATLQRFYLCLCGRVGRNRQCMGWREEGVQFGMTCQSLVLFACCARRCARRRNRVQLACLMLLLVPRLQCGAWRSRRSLWRQQDQSQTRGSSRHWPVGPARGLGLHHPQPSPLPPPSLPTGSNKLGRAARCGTVAMDLVRSPSVVGAEPTSVRPALSGWPHPAAPWPMDSH
jgi:hypothetical protein